jgi:hypothetical protein
MNQREEPFDRCGQCHELGDAGSAGPGQPAGEQLFAFGAFECEDLAELFFEQVGAVDLDHSRSTIRVSPSLTSPVPFRDDDAVPMQRSGGSRR